MGTGMITSSANDGMEFDDELGAFDSVQSGANTASTISAIRLNITVNEVKCCRKISLKGVYGDPNVVRGFLSVFKKKIYEHVGGLPGITTHDLLSNTDISQDTEMSTFRGINAGQDMVST